MNNTGMNKPDMTAMTQQGKTVWRRLVQTARLMVGVGDYQRYRTHMAQHHPEVVAMTETEYFRHCQDSRYPGKDGAMKRCPC